MRRAGHPPTPYRTTFRRGSGSLLSNAPVLSHHSPRPHDLRHTAAALMIQAGGHPKQIQAQLGHSSITLTVDRYGHLFESLADELAQRVGAVRKATS